ncbi:MAG: dihydrofolate reductase family protein [Chloroflexi bacterium]|uniref:Dihydrofolate reductase family protein n=1 Tax=Candidatus Chlorohelix allophototropha TaxID=3003348 RepID=A0A8T7LWA5_9CHLR|nr:dihydrofolate reductase family protein [Chloroflexota bacterium]WJW65669.1 dihydrofolate reductase family protein [Chloroflexota bacterium L227-S17]
MRKVVVSEFLTLDGVMEAPDKWSFQFWTVEAGEFKFAELFASDALLLGRVTYEGFAKAWPSMTDEQGYADRMNSLPKYVVSTTMTKGEWNNSTVLKENIVEEVSKLKQQSGQNILVFGSATLVQTLMEHDLIDEYWLMIYPVVVGNGKKLFRDGINTSLSLVETKTLSSGVIILSYQPVRKEEK